jgi:type VI secretion system FHA domain protein
MNLTLEIVSQNGQSLGPERRKVFGPEGGRIGRAPDCDWVLANPYISRHHATVRWISGTYYIESTGENGVAINVPQAMLPQLERRALRNGDRLFIDEYEVAVGLAGAMPELVRPLSAASAPVGFAPEDDPFAALGPPPASRSLVDPLEPSHDELDPLKQLSGRRPAAPTASPPPESSWNHSPGVSDHFSPPPVPSAIPDDWDKTTFGRQKGTATPAPPSSTSAPAGAPGAIPDDWDKTSFSRGKVPSTPPSPAATPRPLAADMAGTGSRPLQRMTAPVPATPTPMPQRPLPPTAQPVAGALPTQTGAHSGGFDAAALLRAAGVDPATIPPETAGSLGHILRSVVQGVIEVLQARTEIKNQFRMPLTRVKMGENNPLKFAVNAEDALNSLLGRRNPAYLGPVEAFDDAFDDIRFHQLAMLAGMRAGFEQVLSRFDPERLQELFDKRGKRGGLLAMTAKARYWELYAEEFRERTADPDEAFRRLFGEPFSTAYEKQLEELKLSRHKPRR